MKVERYNNNEETYVVEHKDNRELLLKDIENVKKAMESAYMNFENLTEPELIDSCIYELQAIQMKYEYLLSLAKSQNVVADIR